MRKFLYIIALPLLTDLIIMILAWIALVQSCKDCSHFRDFLPETYKILFYVRKIKKRAVTLCNRKNKISGSIIIIHDENLAGNLFYFFQNFIDFF